MFSPRMIRAAVLTFLAASVFLAGHFSNSDGSRVGLASAVVAEDLTWGQ
ncbi:hypothetical protein AB0442_20620 [Kitasatospora sp. NPDC085895]